MKPKPSPLLPYSLAAAALALLIVGRASAQTLLLSDNFDTAGDLDGSNATPEFNDSTSLAADQTGSAATKDYTVFVSNAGSNYAFQRGNGGMWLLYANGLEGGATDMKGSLNYDIAAAANAAGSPLEIKFNLRVSLEVPSVPAGSNWTSITIGGGQNPFVNDDSVGFSSLFRDNGGTQQFSNGGEIGSSATFTDGQLITFVFSNAAGTGSAFNSDGATDVVKMYVNGSLTHTFTGLDLDTTDQYISFHAYNTVGQIDNLAITALTAATDYDTWAGASGFNLSGGQAADDDNDGLSNYEEYAFGLVPNSGASVNPIAVQLDKSTGTFSYTRRKPSFGTGLTYSVWFSENLAVWTEDTSAAEGAPVPSGDNETVPVTLSNLPGDPLPAKLFIQVRAN